MKIGRETRSRCGFYFPAASRMVRLSHPSAANSGLNRPRPREGEPNDADWPAWPPSPFWRAAICN
jgi:hypothetical protein